MAKPRLCLLCKYDFQYRTSIYIDKDYKIVLNRNQVFGTMLFENHINDVKVVQLG